MKPKYYFIHDNCMQWFSYIVEIDGEPDKDGGYDHKQVKKMLEVPTEISGDFLRNILSRETHFSNRRINNTSYYGWALSEAEFKRIAKIVELLPSHREYLKLLHA